MSNYQMVAVDSSMQKERVLSKFSLLAPKLRTAAYKCASVCVCVPSWLDANKLSAVSRQSLVFVLNSVPTYLTNKRITCLRAVMEVNALRYFKKRIKKVCSWYKVLAEVPLNFFTFLCYVDLFPCIYIMTASTTRKTLEWLLFVPIFNFEDL